jgi:hypothetical protein
MESLNLSELNQAERDALAGDIEDWLLTKPGVLTTDQERRQALYTKVYNPGLMEYVSTNLWLLKRYIVASRVSANLAL